MFSKSISSNWVNRDNNSWNNNLIFAQKIFDLLNQNKSVWVDEKNEIIESKECDNELGPFLYFLTGGSSGQKKWIQHNEESMKSAVTGLREFLNLDSISSWCCLPLNHVGGMMQVVRAIETGGQVFFFDYHNLLQDLGTKPFGNWISLVPTQLFRLVKNNTACENLIKFKGIFLGGALLSKKLAEECRDKNLPIYYSYGMTETSGMVSMQKKEDFLKGNYGVGKCLPHANLKLRENDNRILVYSKSMALNVNLKLIENKSWLLTPDIGKICKHGNWQIDGRTDRIIISGGENISLDHVEKFLSQNEYVNACLVKSQDDEEWGKVLVAYIVASNANLEKIISYAKQSLPQFHVPKIWKVCENLPVSEMGKPKV